MSIQLANTKATSDFDKAVLIEWLGGKRSWRRAEKQKESEWKETE